MTKKQDAINKGLATYNTGKPCKHGHLEDRYSSNGACIACVSKWKIENKEKVQKIKQKYFFKYYSKNKEKILENHQKWKKSNPDKNCANENKRRASKLQRSPHWLNDGHLIEIESIYKYCTALRQIGLDYHVDHIVPLQGEFVSGLHVPWNLRVIPASENKSKGNKNDFV